MKILFANRPKQLFQGGDYFQMEETAKALRKLGVEVEISEQIIYTPAIKYRHFDVIHTWNFSMPWTLYQFNLASMYRKPTVCSMIYHDREDYVKFTEQQTMADRLDKAIFINQGEINRFDKKVKIDLDKKEIVPNGIDKFWFTKGKIIQQRPYVLTVGRVEPHKGQLEVAKACKELGLKYVIIGQITNKDYAEKCIEAGAIYEEPMDKKRLRDAYTNCSCFVLNSKAEIQPLTVMEAGAQAKNIVISDGCLWDITGAFKVECDNIEQLKVSITKAISAKPNKELQTWLKSYTWENVAKQLIKIYSSAIKKHEGEPAFIWKINE